MGDMDLAIKKMDMKNLPKDADAWHSDGSIYIGKSNSSKNINIIVHESTHALYYHLSKRGLPLDPSNTEVIAYSMGYMIEKILKTTKKKWFVMNNKTMKF